MYICNKSSRSIAYIHVVLVTVSNLPDGENAIAEHPFVPPAMEPTTLSVIAHDCPGSLLH